MLKEQLKRKGGSYVISKFNNSFDDNRINLNLNSGGIIN